MAFQDFWWNVWTAAGLRRGANIADTPRITSADIAERLSVNNHWARPKSVSGFNVTELTFLSDEDRLRLDGLVKAFRGEVGENGMPPPVTGDTLERARPAFQGIVELLEFDRFSNPEAFALGKSIERQLIPKPPDLDQLRFMTGMDSTNDPALWIWVYVAESGEFDDDRFLAQAKTIEAVLKPIAREVAPEGRVYLTFRSTLDLPEAQGVFV